MLAPAKDHASFEQLFGRTRLSPPEALGCPPEMYTLRYRVSAGLLMPALLVGFVVALRVVPPVRTRSCSASIKRSPLPYNISLAIASTPSIRSSTARTSPGVSTTGSRRFCLARTTPSRSRSRSSSSRYRNSSAARAWFWVEAPQQSCPGAAG